MNPRRWLALAVAIAGALYLFTHRDARGEASPILKLEGPFLPGTHCPPADGYAWTREGEPSSLVYWAIPRNARQVIGPNDATHYRIGTISIIYARISRDWVSEGLREHEECHAAGWTHGETPIGGGMFR